MNEVFVADTSIVTAMGNSMDEMWPKLCAVDSAIKVIQRFRTDRLDYHDGACVEDLIHDEKSPLIPLFQRGKSGHSLLPHLSKRENRFPPLEKGGKGGFERLYSSDTESFICKLMSRALDSIKTVPEDTFTIWTGIKGDVQFIEDRAEGRETRPPYLARHYREWVCSYLGIPNTGLEINAACASSTVGLAIGAQMISEGRCSSVLVCAADMVSRFIFTGFASLRGLSATKCRPFDRDRDGLFLGDGAAAILLVNKESLERMGYTPLARLTGWGIANDANHITGPAKDGRGLINSIRPALAQAGLAPDEVEAYCAHGTGTPYNDAMELTAIETIFGSRRFPIFSVKGAIGHTLGAAGAIEAAISIRSLAEKIAVPTSGLVSPEDRAEGRASDKEQSFPGNNILTSNSGFGGCNAALILEKM